MAITVCPFCGVASDDAHDSQEACIKALHQEIDRARRLLESSEPRPVEGPEDRAPAEAGLGHHTWLRTQPGREPDAK